MPKTGYTGTVTINYTGYNTDGDSFTGTVMITVGRDSTADDIIYETAQDTKITFSEIDFKNICDDATGEDLSYVKFTLPLSSTGKLYYNYTSASNYGSAVSASTKYYLDSEAYLSEVSFVPKTDYTGIVTINYTGYNTDGESYTGKINITVNESSVRSQYFTDVDENFSWATEAIDYLYQSNIVTGTGSGQYNPAGRMSRGDFMLMLYRALKLESSSAAENFSDVAKDSYYYEAIAVAKALGIAQGGGGKFSPKSTLTRQDAMVLVARALEVSGITVAAGSSSDLAGFNDKDVISDYAIDAVRSLVKAKIITGSGLYINPREAITRAEMAVILDRVLKL